MDTTYCGVNHGSTHSYFIPAHHCPACPLALHAHIRLLAKRQGVMAQNVQKWRTSDTHRGQLRRYRKASTKYGGECRTGLLCTGTRQRAGALVGRRIHWEEHPACKKEREGEGGEGVGDAASGLRSQEPQARVIGPRRGGCSRPTRPATGSGRCLTAGGRSPWCRARQATRAGPPAVPPGAARWPRPGPC